MSSNICQYCGGQYIYKDGKYVCPYCGYIKPEEITNEEVNLLTFAASKLRQANFDDAEEAFRDLVQKYPTNSEGYWGLILSKYGVKYEKDYDGKMLPSCYATQIKSFVNDPSFIKAVELGSKDQKEYYKTQAEKIELIRKTWVEKAQKEEPYDIFISYKDSDLANGIDQTQDSHDAYELYNELTKEGYRVFYSRKSLAEKTGEKYEPYIFNALNTAKVMILYSSSVEYVESTWIKNEWMRYYKRLRNGEKQSNSLLVAYKGLNPGDLPNPLNKIQALNASSMTFLTDLKNIVKNIMAAANKVVPKLERVEIKSFEKAESQKLNKLETRKLGSYEAATVTVDDENNLKIAKGFLKKRLFKESAEIVDKILKKNPRSEKALLLHMLISIEAAGIEELLPKIPVFDEYNSLALFFEVAKTENSEKVLTAFTKAAKQSFEEGKFDLFSKIYTNISPYNNSIVLTMHKEIFELIKKAVPKNIKEVEKYVLTAAQYASENNQDEYVKLLSQFAEVCLKNSLFEEAKAYYGEAIKYKSGDFTLVSSLFLASIGSPDGKISPYADKITDFELVGNMIAVNEDIEKQVKVINMLAAACIKFASSHQVDDSNSVFTAFERIIAFIPKSYDKELIADTKKMAAVCKKQHCFAVAEKFYAMLLDIDADDYQSHWGLMQSKLKCCDDNELIAQDTKIDQLPEYQNTIRAAAKLDQPLDYYMDIKIKQENAIKEREEKKAALLKKKKKNKLIALVACIVCICIAAGIGGFFAYWTQTKLQYTDYMEGCSVYSGKYFNETEVVIPASKDGKPVVSIEAGAFENDTNIASLTLPTSLRTIGENAFKGCVNLKTVRFEDVYEENIAYAYDGNDGPNIRLESIMAGAFEGCSLLKSFPFVEALTSIGEKAFRDTGMTSFEFSKNIESIGTRAFENTSIKAIAIPESLVNVGECIFEGCGNIVVNLNGRTSYPSEWGNWISSASSSFDVVCRIPVILKNLYGVATSITEYVSYLKDYKLDVPSRAGYVFQGFFDSEENGVQYVDANGNSVFAFDKDSQISLFARWTANINTLKLNGNNSTSGTMDDIKIATDGKIILPKNIFEKNGYRFIGWSETASGSVLYDDSAEYTMGASGIANLYAVWEVITFSIEYDLNGGTIQSGINRTEYTFTDSGFTIINPVKDGYNFRGWIEGDILYPVDYTIAKGSFGNRHLKAKYEAKANHVVFDGNGTMNGNMEDLEINTDEVKNLPLNTYTRYGYTFLGWAETASGSVKYQDGSEYKMGILDRVTLYAVWEADPFTIVFDGNNASEGSIENILTKTDETIALSRNTFTRLGYNFLGWSEKADATKPDFSDGANYKAVRNESNTDSVMLYAVWSIIEYKITNNFDSSEIRYNVEEGAELNYNLIKKGYIFDGWFLDSDGSEKIEKVEKGTTGDIYLFAKWTIEHYDIIYIIPDDADNSLNPDTYTVEDQIALAVPERLGYEFINWTENKAGGTVRSSIEKGSTGSKVFYANWEIIKYTISLDPGEDGIWEDGVSNPKVYYVNSDDIIINNPVNAGYTFAGWDDGLNIVQELVISKGSTGNKAYTAVWNSDSNTLIFNGNGRDKGNMDTLTFATNEEQTLPINTFERTGYTFEGWSESVNGAVAYRDGAPYIMKRDFKTRTATTYNLYAVWKVIEYTITYELNGGQCFEYNAPIYTVETPTFPVNNPERDGYTFEGWSDGKTVSSAYSVQKGTTGNIVLIALWDAVPYSIEYDLDGGMVFTENPEEYTIETETFTLNNPTKTGYTFVGWQEEGETELHKDYTVSLGNTGNISLKANWELAEYSILYDLDGGILSTENPEEYTIETETFTLNNPTKTGYTFVGWQEEGGEPSADVSVNKGSYGDKSFTAVWNIIEYTISYNLAGGSLSTENRTTYTIEDVFTLAVPSKSYYRFAGWSDGTQIKTEYTFIRETENKSLTALWTAIIYEVVYNLDGGTVSGNNPSSYTVETDTFTLNNPTKSGYTFAGWIGSNGEEKQTSVSVEKGSNGAKIFNACYTPNTYSISLISNGGSSVESPVDVTYDSSYTLAVPTRTGYSFTGWYNSDVQYTNEAGVSLRTFKELDDITLEAKWTLNKYAVSVRKSVSLCTVQGQGSYDYDSSVTLTATSAVGYLFDGWYSEDGAAIESANNPYTFTLGAEDVSLLAKFTKCTDHSFVDYVCTKCGANELYENELLIGSAVDYINLANAITNNNGYEGYTIILGQDISLSADTLSEHPFGSSGYPFKGIFNGNGHTITITDTFTFSSTATSVFPFARGTIKNLTIAASNVMNGNGLTNIAVFVGQPSGNLTIENCTNEVSIENAMSDVGGFVGQSGTNNRVVLINCINKGHIYSTQYDSTNDKADMAFGTGGVVGRISDTTTITIDGCKNIGEIRAPQNVGGIVGISHNTIEIFNSANIGNVTSFTAGSEASGDLEGFYRTFSNAGGIIGKTAGNGYIRMYASYNSGTITAYGSIAGGLVGSVGDFTVGAELAFGSQADKTSATSKSYISYCYNMGLVQTGGTYGKYVREVLTDDTNCAGTIVGGIAGLLGPSHVSYCYNSGRIISWGTAAYNLRQYQYRMGGIAGEVCAQSETLNTHVEYCYNVGHVEGRSPGWNGVTRGNVDWANDYLYYGAGIIGYIPDPFSAGSSSANYTDYNDIYSVRNSVYIVSKSSSWMDVGPAFNEIANQDHRRVSGTIVSEEDLIADYLTSEGILKPAQVVYSGFGAASYSTVLDEDGLLINYAENSNFLNGTLPGWIYVYGCLPQLAVFVFDTENSLSVLSKSYVKDGRYDYYTETYGFETSPFIVSDGTQFMAYNALCELGFPFSSFSTVFGDETTSINLADFQVSDKVLGWYKEPTFDTSVSVIDTEGKNPFRIYPMFNESLVVLSSAGDVEISVGANNFSADPLNSYSGEIVKGTQITLTAPDSVNGYTWNGWYSGEILLSSLREYSFVLNADITIESKWDIVVYSITYELNGGSLGLGNPSIYTVETATFALNNPIKTGYRFVGWSDGTGISEIVTILKGSYGNKSYDAVWTIETYTISYNLEGGTNSANPEAYSIASGDITLLAPEKAGYEFAGWSGSDLTDITKVVVIPSGSTGNREYTANWQIITYSITYELSGGTVFPLFNASSYTVETASFTLKNPTKTGYTFVGWNSDYLLETTKDVTIALGSTGNRKYTAVYTPVQYALSIDYTGGTPSAVNPEYYTIEFETFVINNPSKTGYDFTGWEVNSDSETLYQTYEIQKGSTGQISLTAHWELSVYTISYEGIEDNTYTVSFNSNGGTSVAKQVVSPEVGLVYPSIPTKTGYAFKGWYTTSDCTTLYSFTSTVSKDMTLYAGWQAMVSSSYNQRRYVDISKHVSSDTANSLNTSSTSSSNMNYDYFTAFSSGTYNLYYYNVDYQTYHIMLYVYNVTKGSEIISTTVIDSSAYQSVSFSVSNGDIIYIRAYSNSSGTALKYYVKEAKLPSDGGKGLKTYENDNPVSYTYTDGDIILNAPTRLYYDFAGWTYDGVSVPQKNVTIPSGSLGNKVYTANWTPHKYTITYDLEDGVINNAQNPNYYTIEDADIVLAEPSRNGYTFSSWKKELGFLYIVISEIKSGSHGDITVKAYWTINQYNITFADADAETMTYTINDSVNLPTPVKVGYNFIGWSGQGISGLALSYTIPVGTYGNLVYTANWEIINYSISYNLNGGDQSSSNPVSYNVTNGTVYLNSPNKLCCKFVGWFVNEETITKISPDNIANISTGTDIYLSAKWDELVTVTEENEYYIVDLKYLYAYDYSTEYWNLSSSKSNVYYKVADENGIGIEFDSPSLAGSNYSAILTSTNVLDYVLESTNLPYLSVYDVEYAWLLSTEGTGLITSTRNHSAICTISLGGSQLSRYEVSARGKNKNVSQNVLVTPNVSVQNMMFRLELRSDPDSAQYAHVVLQHAQIKNIKIKVKIPQYSICYFSDVPGTTGNMPYTQAQYGKDYQLADNQYSRTGYIFKGWATSLNGPVMYSDKQIVRNLSATDGSIVALYAVWEPCVHKNMNECTCDDCGEVIHIDVDGICSRCGSEIVYSINYYSSYGLVSNPSIYTLSTSDFTLSNPTRDGYTFDGWSGTGLSELSNSVTITKGSTGNRVYTAHWTPITYTITYIIADGENPVSNPTTYTIESNIILQNPVREHYDGSWKLGDNQITQIVAVYGNIELTAVWSPHVYNITYNLDGGINNNLNPDTYTVNDDITLENPFKEDEKLELLSKVSLANDGTYSVENRVKVFDFDGWYLDSAFETEIEKITSYEDLELYAKWSERTITAMDTEHSYTRTGKYIYFGTYPQSKVTDSVIVSALNTLSGTLPTPLNSYEWTSYGYNGTGSADYMWYIDINYNGEKYRGVYFTSYRTNGASQYDNGYYTSIIYWFKYQPIRWRIDSESNGEALIYSDMVLDSQAFNTNNSSNKWSESTVREWLNEEFYNIAFNDLEKSVVIIQDVKSYYSLSGYNQTKDRIILLDGHSWLVPKSPFALTETIPERTAYSACQGASDKLIWLRSADADDKANYINSLAKADSEYVYKTNVGIVPSIKIQLYDVYSISYDVDGGVNDPSNPSKYTVEDTIDLLSPFREDSVEELLIEDQFAIRTTIYIFDGWYTESAFENRVSTISGYGNVSLYAKWVENTTIEVEQPYVIEGDYIYFGSYPQTEITDESIVLALNTLAGTKPTASNSYAWTSYGYYQGDAENNPTNATSYMWYIDKLYNGEKYRGVYFTSYRPHSITELGNADNSYQDDNGYSTSTAYWFRYELIKWRVLDEYNGEALILCDSIIDSQNFSLQSNDWESSTIRAWLNNELYEVAFVESQKALIKQQTLSTAEFNGGTETTEDKIFLLSQLDMENSDYGFSSSLYVEDTTRIKKATSYALCQGISVPSNSSDGSCYYIVRSPDCDYGGYNFVYYVDSDGSLSHERGVQTLHVATIVGIAPALKIELS